MQGLPPFPVCLWMAMSAVGCRRKRLRIQKTTVHGGGVARHRDQALSEAIIIARTHCGIGLAAIIVRSVVGSHRLATRNQKRTDNGREKRDSPGASPKYSNQPHESPK